MSHKAHKRRKGQNPKIMTSRVGKEKSVEQIESRGELETPWLTRDTQEAEGALQTTSYSLTEAFIRQLWDK